jgi:hypothetical protein
VYRLNTVLAAAKFVSVRHACALQNYPAKKEDRFSQWIVRVFTRNRFDVLVK